MEENGTLDLRGLKCPLPALLARRRLAHLAPGEALTLLTSDPLAVVDIPHMCAQEGHVLVDARPQEGHHQFTIRRRIS
jgi:tRNA 2-thiouridine synthesizing protein A